jgi:hypothetical protein
MHASFSVTQTLMAQVFLDTCLQAEWPEFNHLPKFLRIFHYHSIQNSSGTHPAILDLEVSHGVLMDLCVLMDNSM